MRKMTFCLQYVILQGAKLIKFKTNVKKSMFSTSIMKHWQILIWGLPYSKSKLKDPNTKATIEIAEFSKKKVCLAPQK
jgi:hypothetical protein